MFKDRKLTKEQEQIVQAQGHVLAIACPGSGKTTTLTYRAAHLLSRHPEAVVLAATFSRNAAQELEARLRKLVPGARKRVICGTFHKLSLLQLRRSGRNPNVIYDAHRLRLIRSMLESVGYDHLLPEQVGELIEKHKATCTQIIGRPEDRELVSKYDDLLRERGLVDLQDLVLQAVMGMEDGTIDPWQADFLLGDEIQDCDSTQWAWIHAHALRMPTTLVGDDDQTIYGWRYARGFKGMNEFRETHGAATMMLSTSHRCPNSILSEGARLLSRNKDRFDKPLSSTNRTSHRLSVARFASAEDEAANIAECVAAQTEGQSCGILARTNAVLDVIEAALCKNGVRYLRLSTESLLDQRAVQLYMNFLDGFIHGHINGVEALLLELHWPKEDVDWVRKRCTRGGKSPLHHFSGMDVQGRNAARRVRDVQAYTRRLLDVDDVDGDPIWMSAFAVKAAVLVPEHGQIDLCARILEKMSNSSLASRLQALRRKKESHGAEGITLATIHASKGMEFSRVLIAGCNQRIGIGSFGHDEMEEERRVLYVGITRSAGDVRMSYVQNHLTEASKLLDELAILRHW